MKQIHCSPQTTCFDIPLEPRKIIKKAIGGGTGGLIFYIIFLFIYMLYWIVLEPLRVGAIDIITGYLSLVITILLLLVLLAILYQVFYFRYYFYDITPEEIIIMKGVIARRRISVRYEKIQNIFIDQDFLDRIFKLYDVHIATADVQSAAVAHIDEVSRENAEKLKSILDEGIRSNRGQSGV